MHPICFDPSTSTERWNKTIHIWRMARGGDLATNAFHLFATKTFDVYSRDPDKGWRADDIMLIYLEIPYSSTYDGVNENQFTMQRCEAMVTWKSTG